MNDCCQNDGLQEQTYDPNQLLGCGPHKTQEHPIEIGANIVRGQVLYFDAASKELSADPAGKEAFAISVFTEDFTAAAAATSRSVYVSGEFMESEITLNGGDATDVKNQLRERGIFLKAFA